MGTSNNLGFKVLIELWEENLKQSQTFSPSDIQELKSHLLDHIEELTESGLSKEKAFLLASKAVGRSAILEDDYLKTNQPYIQTRKALLVTAGAIVYYCFSYFILFLAKISVVFGKQLNMANNDLFLLNIIILGIPVLFVLFFFVSLLINDKYLFEFIDKIQIRPKHAVYLVILTFIAIAADKSMLPFLNHLLPDKHWRYRFMEIYMDFEYILLALILIGFVTVFLKYFRNNGSPVVK